MGPKEEVEELKKQGNDCVRAGNFIEAMLHYTKAIKIDEGNATLYSNRSLTFLKMDQYYHALEDAKMTVKLNPKWPKGFYRKGEAEFKAEHYNDAVVSYRSGTLLDPEDEGLRNALAKAQTALRKQVTHESRMPWYGLVLGLLIGGLIIAGDMSLAKKPVLAHWSVQLVLCLALALVGAGVGLIYRYFVRQNRASYLQPPPDMLGEDGEEDKSSKDTHKHDNHRRSGGVAAARQRMRKGKAS